jgi:ATP-dependent DNA helicase RecG
MPFASLATEIQYVKGVGPKWAELFKKIDVFTVEDLLFKLPRRYEDRSTLPSISELYLGRWATIHGQVGRIESKTFKGGRVMLRAYVRDGSGTVCLTWFNQPWIKGQLEKSSGEIYAYGQVKDGQNGFEIASPEWEAVGGEEDPEEFGKIVPVYPLTEGLPQKIVRRAMRAALRDYLPHVQDALPEELRRAEGLREVQWCLSQIQAPKSEPERQEARLRLVFEEFYYLQLGLALKRNEIHGEHGIAFPVKALMDGREEETLPSSTGSGLFAGNEPKPYAGEPLMTQIRRVLPFELTNAQKKVIREIWSDMSSPHPMNRLVQGDVGSGKTAVAICAMLTAVRSGYQAAIMAPTEILAEQHYINIKRLLEPLEIPVGLIVGQQTARERSQVSARVASGEIKIAVGTHALIQSDLKFAHLGLTIVDEQHRFGVLQRKALRDKANQNPDVLVMTATPIPRTLTMAIYGDLDLSVIDELPPGRRPIKTHWKRTSERDAVYATVQALVAEGRQAYFVCPLVSESEKMMAQAAEDLYLRLKAGPFSDKRIELLHGQLKSREKEEVMRQFRTGEIDVLVSTTVIEVGVDVPNASVMVIEDANRFGLSALHQLRGRVGRGDIQSYCIVIADGKSGDARERLTALVGTNDGFKIAEEDLRLRGPGILAGTQQAGHADFKFGDLVQDGKLLEVARQAAIRTIEENPTLAGPKWAAVLKKTKEARGKASVITVS